MKSLQRASIDMQHLSTVLDISPTINNVSLGLYGAAASAVANGNFMVSPLSILYSTILVYLGARGSTRTNLYNSLDFVEFSSSGSDADIVKAFGQLMKDLKLQSAKKPKKEAAKGTSSRKNNGTIALPGPQPRVQMQLALANAIFLQQTLDVDKNYLSTVSTDLKASIEKKDFIKNYENARQDISKWAEERTGGKIKDLIPAGGVDGSTVAVLANAIYFKAQWQKRFDQYLTDQNAKFNTLDGKSVPAKMMRMNHEFNYAEDSQLDVQYVEIPYADNEASLLVFLPKKATGLRDLEKALTAQSIAALAKKAQEEDYKVELKLPKFRLESSFDMVELLQKIGVNDVFTEAADLSGIVPMGGVQVTKGFHKTFIEVDEKGTEAAAASAIVLTAKMAFVEMEPKKRVKFYADHPFVYAIRHNRSKAILFMGRVETL